jgi:hypothetical protein
MERLARLLSEDRRGEIQTAYISEKVLVEFANMPHDADNLGDFMGVYGVRDLETLLHVLWPSMFD